MTNTYITNATWALTGQKLDLRMGQNADDQAQQHDRRHNASQQRYPKLFIFQLHSPLV